MKIFLTTVFFLAAASQFVFSQQHFVTGKNRFTTECDGDTREYYVHVPKRYAPGTRLPVVIMLHGTTGNGLRFYQISGWKELGDSLNIITVFPSSWTYCLVEDDVTGHTANTSRWNDFGLKLCATETQHKRDDIHFLNRVIDELIATFSVDSNRIYVAGFSNGGQMAGRCAIELSQRLAAVVNDAGTFAPDSIAATPNRKLPVLFRLGNTDSRWLRHASVQSLPMEIAAAKTALPVLQQTVDSHIARFALTTNGISKTLYGGKVITATYTSLIPQPNNLFVFMLVQDLDHKYPNTRNHWMYGAAIDWLFMSRYHK